MFKFKALGFAFLAFATVWHVPSTAEAGPLLDWFLGRRSCRRPACYQQQPVVAALPSANCQTTCMQTCQRTVVNYVPCTSYRTSWQRVPVTSYRPQSNTDPCTGCTVTCMKPCTTYTYRAVQTPYTTYRPVYRTQAYQVPITYTSQAPQIHSPIGGCNSCGVQPMIQQPVANVPTITGALNPAGTYTTVPNIGTQIPANTQPQLQQRPIIIEQPTPAVGTSSRLNAPARQQAWPTNPNLNPINATRQDSGGEQYQPPQLFDVEPKTARATEIQSPVFKRFDYSPVRSASLQTSHAGHARTDQRLQQSVYAATVQRERNSNQSNTSQSTTSQPTPRQINQGWRSLAK